MLLYVHLQKFADFGWYVLISGCSGEWCYGYVLVPQDLCFLEVRMMERYIVIY